MNIYVGNLSFGATEDDIRQMFESFGQVDEVRVITDKFSGKSKGFGFVEMASDEEARKAVEELDGQEMLGRNIKVSEAQAKKEGGGGGGRGGRGGFGGRGGGGRGGYGGGGGRGQGGGGRDRGRGPSRY